MFNYNVDYLGPLAGTPGLVPGQQPSNDLLQVAQGGARYDPMSLGLVGAGQPPEEQAPWWQDRGNQRMLAGGLGALAGELSTNKIRRQMRGERDLARGVSNRAAASWAQSPVRRAEGGPIEGWLPESDRQIDTSNMGFIRYLLGQMQGRRPDWFPTDPRPLPPQVVEREEPSLMQAAASNIQERKNSLNYAEGGALGFLRGGTTGQSDKVPALLSDGEYVMDADAVSALGDGNNAAGAAALDQLRQNLRRHKRAAPASKIPPKAKRPEAYLGKKGGK